MSAGARVRTDIVDVYVFRVHPPGALEFLQLLRADGSLTGTWQPVMGHAEEDEPAWACAWRELEEETGLGASDAALQGLFALQGVHPYYRASSDAIVLSPRFGAHVAPDWAPRLNHEHSAHRWVAERDVASFFMWPGQRAACAEIVSLWGAGGAETRERLRITPRTARPGPPRAT